MGVAAYLWWKLELNFPAKDSVLSSTLSVSGIFVGFLATSKSILMTMSSPIIERLRSSGYMNVLATYIAQAIWLNLLFCTINVVGFFANQGTVWFPTAWVTFAVGALTSFIRVTHVMLQIFKHH